MIDAITIAAHAFNPTHPQQFLRYIRISGKRVVASDGTATIAVPVDTDISVNADGDKLLRVIAQLKTDAPNVYVTATNRLGLSAGTFRAFVPCVESIYEYPTPEGTEIVIADPHDFLAALSAVAVFADAKNPHDWARGVVVRDGCVYATNNHILVQRWLGVAFPRNIILPAVTVDLLAKLKIEPTRILCAPNSITFFFGEGAYLRSALLTSPPPDLAQIVEATHSWYTPDDFALVDITEACATVVEATDAKHVFVERKQVTAIDGDTTAQVTIDCPASPEVGGALFAWRDLKLALPAATRGAAFHKMPERHGAFLGDRMRGVIIGLKGGHNA